MLSSDRKTFKQLVKKIQISEKEDGEGIQGRIVGSHLFSLKKQDYMHCPLINHSGTQWLFSTSISEVYLDSFCLTSMMTNRTRTRVDFNNLLDSLFYAQQDTNDEMERQGLFWVYESDSDDEDEEEEEKGIEEEERKHLSKKRKQEDYESFKENGLCLGANFSNDDEYLLFNIRPILPVKTRLALKAKSLESRATRFEEDINKAPSSLDEEERKALNAKLMRIQNKARKVRERSEQADENTTDDNWHPRGHKYRGLCMCE